MRSFFLILLLSSVSFAKTEDLIREVIAYKPVLHKITDQTSLTLLAAGTVSVLGVHPYDDRIRDQWVDHQQMSKSVSSLGDFLGAGFGSALVLGGQYWFDSNDLHWKNHARALVWDTLIVGVMKYSFGRQRPGGSRDHKSFPSGHTATAFVTATSLTYAYGWKAAVIAYPLATLVGFSRLADDAHWASDVVGGAFVGFIVGRATSFDETDENKPSQSHFIPVVGPEFSGLNYIYTF